MGFFGGAPDDVDEALTFIRPARKQELRARDLTDMDTLRTISDADSLARRARDEVILASRCLTDAVLRTPTSPRRDRLTVAQIHLQKALAQLACILDEGAEAEDVEFERGEEG